MWTEEKLNALLTKPSKALVEDMKKIKEIAKQIALLEKECALGKNVQSNMAEIEKIMSTLSIEEMFEVDEYITRKKLLT